MGAAAEWLTRDEREAIALAILVNPKLKPNKVGANCPFHSESTPGGAFFYDPDKDVGCCHSCSVGADLIGMYCAVRGLALDDPDGFREFRDRYAPHAARDGKDHVRKPLAPKAPEKPAARIPRDPELPPDLWRDRAGEFVKHAAERLQASPERMEQLAKWGIAPETAAACRLGWNDHDKYPPYPSWGLPPERKEDGNQRKVWLPVGLVIPFFQAGQVVSIKIRRENPQDGPEALRELRYYMVKGSAPRYFVYGRPDWTVWAIVETERDAALLWQEGRRLRIGCMATGSASARPDKHAHEILRSADAILVALDADGAGGTNTGFWLEEYPQAIRWPVPPSLGKDAGDAAGKTYLGQPFDFAAWLLAGLPISVRRRLEKASKRPEISENGGENAAKTTEKPDFSAESESFGSRVCNPGDKTNGSLHECSDGLDKQSFGFSQNAHWLDSGDDSPIETAIATWMPDSPEKTALLELFGLLRANPIRIKRRLDAAGVETGLALDSPVAWSNRNGEILARVAELFWVNTDAFFQWVRPDSLPEITED